MLAFVVTFALGTVTELVSVQPLIARSKELDFEMVTFITTFAVAIFLTNVALQHFGPFQKNVPPEIAGGLELYNGVAISYHELLMAGISLVLMGGLGLLLAQHALGAARSARSRRISTRRGSVAVPVTRLYPPPWASPRRSRGSAACSSPRSTSPRRTPATCRCCRPSSSSSSAVSAASRGRSTRPTRRAHPGVCEVEIGDHLDGADPLRRDTARARRPAERPQGQPRRRRACDRCAPAIAPARWAAMAVALVLLALMPLVYTTRTT